MNSKKLHLIHTSAILEPVFDRLCSTRLSGVEVIHLADDSLIKDVIEAGEVTEDVAGRVLKHIQEAEAAGADCILVTCSSIGRAVEAASAKVRIPVQRVDEPMAERAVEVGRRIGVIATLATTLEPTAELVSRCATRVDKQIELETRLCEGAFEALVRGDADVHDRIVADELHRLAAEVDVVVLAQASMARVAENLPQSEGRVPILSSPPLAVEYIASIL